MELLLVLWPYRRVFQLIFLFKSLISQDRVWERHMKVLLQLLNNWVYNLTLFEASIRTRSNFCNAIFSFLGNYYRENRTSYGNFSDSYQNNFVSSSLIDGSSYCSSNFLKLFNESENYTSPFSNGILQIKLKSQIGEILLKQFHHLFSSSCINIYFRNFGVLENWSFSRFLQADHQ